MGEALLKICFPHSSTSSVVTALGWAYVSAAKLILFL